MFEKEARGLEHAIPKRKPDVKHQHHPAPVSTSWADHREMLSTQARMNTEFVRTYLAKLRAQGAGASEDEIADLRYTLRLRLQQRRWARRTLLSLPA